MSDLESLKLQVQGLLLAELADFRAWFLEFDAAVLDRKIEADLAAGKLKELIEEARAECQAQQNDISPLGQCPDRDALSSDLNGIGEQ